MDTTYNLARSGLGPDPFSAVVSAANPLQRAVFTGTLLCPLPCVIAPKSAHEDVDTRTFVSGPPSIENSVRILGVGPTEIGRTLGMPGETGLVG